MLRVGQMLRSTPSPESTLTQSVLASGLLDLGISETFLHPVRIYSWLLTASLPSLASATTSPSNSNTGLHLCFLWVSVNSITHLLLIPASAIWSTVTHRRQDFVFLITSWIQGEINIDDSNFFRWENCSRRTREVWRSYRRRRSSLSGFVSSSVTGCAVSRGEYRSVMTLWLHTLAQSYSSKENWHFHIKGHKFTRKFKRLLSEPCYLTTKPQSETNRGQIYPTWLHSWRRKV